MVCSIWPQTTNHNDVRTMVLSVNTTVYVRCSKAINIIMKTCMHNNTQEVTVFIWYQCQVSLSDSPVTRCSWNLCLCSSSCSDSSSDSSSSSSLSGGSPSSHVMLIPHLQCKINTRDEGISFDSLH